MSVATALFGVPVSILDEDDIWVDEHALVTPVPEQGTKEEAVAPEQDDKEEAVAPEQDAKEESVTPGEEAVAPNTDNEGVTLEDFQGLSLKDLKEFAKVLSVATSGTKSALVSRITGSVLPLGMEELPEPFTRFTGWFTNKN